MAGIWASPTKYIEFEEVPSAAVLSREIATRGTAWDWSSLMGMMPDPDPVLTKLHGGVELLESLTADDHVICCIQDRKSATLGLEWRWKAGARTDEKPDAAALKLRDDLAADLERADMESLISQIIDAPLYGFTPIEILWEAEAGRLRIKDLRALPCRWFGFDTWGKPKFLSQKNPFEGEDLPFGKFVFARHYPTYSNPYGLRLLSRCFWPVAFKKGGLQWWVTFAEKYGLPWVIGKYGSASKKEDREEMLTRLSAMVRDAVAVIPEGASVDLLTHKGGGQTVHERLCAAMDRSISKAIMGQTLTAEVGEKGSYAASKTHETVLESYQEADQKLVKTTMEEIAWIYGLVNAPAVSPPEWAWYEEEDLQADRAERDGKNCENSGLKLSKSYLVRTYGYQEGDFVEDKKEPGGDFAEGDGDHQGQVDRLAESSAGQAGKFTNAAMARIMALVKKAETPEELEQALADAQGEFLEGDFDELLSRALLAADMFGQWAAEAEGED